MAYIYIIKNDINNKVYIGKTIWDINKRFKEHCRDSEKRKNEKRPLYNAMNKYGIEHFYIELIEECPTEEASQKEQFWIKYFNSFKNGYNATLGGDGKSYLNKNEIIEYYKKYQNISLISKMLNIDPHSISRILKENNIKIKSNQKISQEKTGKKVEQWTLDNKFVRTFNSSLEAAKFLNKITSTSKGASSHISDVCKGKRKTAYGFKWNFLDKNE